MVTRRNVNPGNNVQVGQSLMAVRSLTEIWIDANFKETQLADLRIGQRVRCEVDMYGRRREFEGRITGFTMGTGQTLALLPPQNATGNFVKIVQRLPVRIELTDYDPGQGPLVRRPVGVALRVLQGAAQRGRTPGTFLQPLTPLPQRPAPEPKLLKCLTEVLRHEQRGDLPHPRSAARRSTPGSSPWPWSSRRSWKWWTRRWPTWRCATSPAACRRRSSTASGSSPATWPPTPSSCRSRGWLSAHFGRRNYFLLSIAVFTLASGLCGMATSLPQLILFRVLQGLAGGGLQPSSQAVLLDSFPREKQGAAMTMFGVAALLGPIVGPTLGGWLVDTYNWRWIFYINLPVGVFGFLACYALLDDPDYLKQERAELKKRPLNFDGIGLGLLALVMASWEVVLSKGQEWDWLGDPFWRVQTLLIVFVLGLGGLLYREMRFASPVVNFRVLGERNFAASCIIIFSAFAVLYAATVALPGMLQTLFGYDAYHSGLVHVAGRFLLDHDDGGRRRSARPRGRCPLADRAGPGDPGGGQLLDGADEPPDQPVAGGLAAGGDDRRPVADLRPDQRGRFSLHSQAPARGGGGPAGPAPQRGRQFRHVDGPDHPGAPRAVPPVPSGRQPWPA